MSDLAHVHALLEDGRYDEAEAALRDAAAPGASEACRMLGRLLLQRGEWAEALRWLEASREPDAAFDVAWCLFKLERYGEAAMALEPLRDDPRAAHLLGRAWLEAGRAAEALPVLAGCGLPAADLQAGWCHFVLGRPDAAAACWERWMRAGAADWGTKDALAMFLFLLGGGRRPGGVPERPAEPLRDMDHWFRLLLGYGLFAEAEAAVERGPQLGPQLWPLLRRRWRATASRMHAKDLAARLRDE